MIDYSQVLKTHQFHKVQGSICGAVHVGIVVTKASRFQSDVIPKSIPQVFKLAYTFDAFSTHERLQSVYFTRVTIWFSIKEPTRVN